MLLLPLHAAALMLNEVLLIFSISVIINIFLNIIIK